MQERIAALAWWGVAYLIGGFSGALWRFGEPSSPLLPPGLAEHSVVRRRRHDLERARGCFTAGRFAGAPCASAPASGLSPAIVPAFAALAAPPAIVLSSIIVATYTFLIAAELWRERRKSLIRRWPALFVPMLHGAIFLFPVALASSRRAQHPPPAGSPCSRSKSCSMSSAPLSSCWSWRRTAPSTATRRRPTTDPLDRPAQPPRLFRGRRRA